MLPTGTVKSGGSRQAIAKLNLTDRVRCETNLPKTTLIGNSRHSKLEALKAFLHMVFRVFKSQSDILPVSHIPCRKSYICKLYVVYLDLATSQIECRIV